MSHLSGFPPRLVNVYISILLSLLLPTNQFQLDYCKVLYIWLVTCHNQPSSLSPQMIYIDEAYLRLN